MNNPDDILYAALSPVDIPSDQLNRSVLMKAKEKRMKDVMKCRRKIHPAVAAVAAAVFLFSAVTAFAAWRHLSAREVAEAIADDRLAEEFENNNRLEQSEVQRYGGYDVDLLGVVSGKKFPIIG